MKKAAKTNKVIVQVKDCVTAEDLIKGMVKALNKGFGEFYVTIEKDGKLHFTSIRLNDIIEVLKKAGNELKESINNEIC